MSDLGSMPAPPLATAARLALGLALLLLVGLLVVVAARGGRRPTRWRPVLGDLALAWAAGPAVAVPLVAIAATAGMPLRGRPLALCLSLIAAGVASVLVVRSRGRVGRQAEAAAPAEGTEPVAAPHSVLSTAAYLTLAAALAVASWKVAVVRLWSWDHFAIWGLKARLFAAAGNLDPALVERFEAVPTVLDYPLGVSVAWLTATLGALPDDTVVRAFQLGWIVALVMLVEMAARRLSGDRLVAAAAAAFVAVSPLLWDSVHLGLADLPLALYAVAAVAAVLSASGGREGEAAPGAHALAGLFVGFLPWVKSEGASFAVLLALAIVVWGLGDGRPRRRGELVAFAVPAAVSGGAAMAVGRFVLPEGVGFFDGRLAARLTPRIADPGEVLSPVVGELVSWDWLGVWPAFVLLLFVAVWRRDRAALALAAVVVTQLALYTAVFFGSYIPPADHVATALPRIAAALVPLVALAAAALAAPRSPGATFAREIRS